jgi:ribonuclease HI
MLGRKLIAQAVIGGYTQFLTKAQGMPPEIEDTLTRIIRDFMWEGYTLSKIALENLHRPIEEGGLNLIDIKARNDAIELTWLKAYLDFSPTRPTWAKITDLIIDAAMPQGPNTQTRINCFLQTWNPPQKGNRAAKLDQETLRMLKAAQKYNVNFAAIRLNAHLKAQLPAWYHIGMEPRPIRNNPTKCLISKHNAMTIADLLQVSARLRNPEREIPHQPSIYCRCPDCREDREKFCWTPHECAKEALTRINITFPKLNPLHQDRHGNLSLTPNRKRRNHTAKENNEAILFDPSMTSKNHLAECFRVFTDPERISRNPAQRHVREETNQRYNKTVVYTDGACYNNGKQNAKCGGGIWFGPDDPRNWALRVPENDQSNQIGELAAVIATTERVPPFAPLEIVTDSTYVINGLTTYLPAWEDLGWINIKNAPFFKKAAHLLKRRSATTHFKWIKGHSGNQGNEESNALAKRGADKEIPDELNLTIPIDFDTQGAKLSTITQLTAYQGIMKQRPRHDCQPTAENLNRTRDAIETYCGTRETDRTIWKSLRKKVLRTRVKQFLYKTMHRAYMVGSIWTHIPGYEHRHLCITCNVEDSMEHILTRCNAPTRRKVWELARETWPHAPEIWPNINLGIILGIGALNLPVRRANRNRAENNQHPTPGPRATLRLLQIFISEAAHLVWVLRCERVIQEKTFNNQTIRNRWHRAINDRLTTDRITAYQSKRDHQFTKLAKRTWKKLLKQYGTLPVNWFQNREVLVGIRA